jgi:hypothetical protein
VVLGAGVHREVGGVLEPPAGFLVQGDGGAKGVAADGRGEPDDAATAGKSPAPASREAGPLPLAGWVAVREGNRSDRDAMPLPNLVFEVSARLCLGMSCQTAEHPTDFEWDAYLSALAPFRGRGDFRSLVITTGGHPSRGQQDRLRQCMGTTRVRVAIVSPAAGLRFLTSALSLFNPNIRCFAPAQHAVAFAHIGVGPAESRLVADTIERLQRKLEREKPARAEARP